MQNNVSTSLAMQLMTSVLESTSSFVTELTSQH